MESTDTSRKRTVHAVLEQQAEKYGDKTFFHFKDRPYSYNELNNGAARVARGLQAMGISKGDKVGIMLDNCPEFLFSWFGVCKAGGVEVPLNTAHKGDMLEYLLNQSDCRVLIVDNRYTERLYDILANVPGLQAIVVVEGTGKSDGIDGRTVMDWDALIANCGDYRPVDIVWSDPFIVMFTSGTTGPSKGALMPHNYGVFMGEGVCEMTDYAEDDCLYNVLPLFHGNAQLLSTMPALLSGARMVLAEKFSASRFWDDIKRHRCTEFNYIGGILPILYKAEPKPADADNPLRIMMGAGAPMDLFEAFEKRFGVTLIEGYGMSEIGTPLMNTVKERKPGTCGKPRPDYVVKVVDDDCAELGPNMSGELLIRPLKPHCMFLEYYKMPEKTVEACADLWFHTGDYLYYDEDGYFHFVDRKKDALRRRGENISSYEVEKAINTHPSVSESAAVAVKSELGEDEVMICLALKNGKTLQMEDLMAFCEDRMAHFMIPRYVRVMERMPKTPTERVKKNVLREEGVTPDTWDREEAGYIIKR